MPHSFCFNLSYYGLVLDLQKLGRDIFLLQVFFGAVDFLAQATMAFLLRFFGCRTILASSLAMSGLAILANGLIPRGAARASGEKASGLPSLGL